MLARLHAQAVPDAWPEPAFSSLLSRPEVFVLLGATHDVGDAQGFILIRIAADEAEVLTFCVAEAARRVGLGTALLKAACGMVRQRGCVQVFLEVSQENRSAFALYQKCGFAIVGRRTAYYRHGTLAADAIVMRKPISSDGSAEAGGVAPSFQVAPESTKSG